MTQSPQTDTFSWKLLCLQILFQPSQVFVITNLTTRWCQIYDMTVCARLNWYQSVFSKIDQPYFIIIHYSLDRYY